MDLPERANCLLSNLSQTHMSRVLAEKPYSTLATGEDSRLRDLNRGSEWDFGSAKDIILIAFFWIINNCVRNEGLKVQPQTWTT